MPYHGHADCYDAGTPEEIVAQWKKHGQNTMRFWGTSWKGMGQAEALDFFDRNGVIVRRTGLFDGEGGNYGLVETVKVNGKDVTRARKALFDNWASQLKAEVRGERNHPSIMIWSIENEITFINSRNWGLSQWVEPAIRDVAQAGHGDGPTRPAMTDGGHAMVDQSMPINGVHYGESDLRDYPDEAYTCDKLFHQPQTIWKYDTTKPGFLGESLYTTGQAPSFYAGLQGESAFLGRSESAKGESLWVKMCLRGIPLGGPGRRPLLDDRQHRRGLQFLAAGGRLVPAVELDQTFSITKQRGQWFSGPHGIPLVASFHPAYILRQTGGELTAVKRLVWDDLKAVRAKLDTLAAAGPPPPKVVQPDLFAATNPE